MDKKEKKQMKRRQVKILEDLAVSSPPKRSIFKPDLFYKKVGFNDLTWPLQVLVIFGWVFIVLFVVNIFIFVASFVSGGI